MKKNKNIKTLIIILFLEILLSHKFLWCQRLKNIFLEEVLSIGSLEDDDLFQWAGVTVDLEGNIYVTDAMDYSIKKFSDKGILIKKTGRKGQGPGEFLAIRNINYASGKLFVSDQNKLGIQIFDEDLNFKYTIPVKILIIDFQIITEEHIAVSSLSMSKSETIRIYDFQGNVKESIKYSEEDSQFLMNMVKFAVDKNGNFYLLFIWQDRIEKFNRNRKRVWRKSLLKKKEIKLKADKSGTFKYPTEVIYKDMALDTSGNLFVLGGHRSKHRSRDVYVLNQDGEHFTTFTLPESSHCIYIDSKNFLYARAGMGTALKKYGMKYIYE